MNKFETFSPREEAALVKRLRKRDGKAWREFAGRYRSLCYFLAKRFRCQNNFEDFYSELMLSFITRDLDSFEPGQSLTKAVSRRFSDIVSAYLRRSRRETFGALYEDAFREPSASFLAEREETYAMLENARGRLSEEENLLLEEYFDDGLTLNAIAGKRGLHSTTVLRRLKKIYAKLSRLMDAK